MASEITVTAANVRPVTKETIDSIRKLPAAEAAITAGQVVYIHGTAGTNLALATTTIADATNRLAGVAVNGAAIGEIVEAATRGPLTGFSDLTPGVLYVLSEDVAGGIKAYADIASGDFQGIIGLARDATTILLDVQDTLALKP